MGARSAVYQQLLADLSGREVTIADVDEAVATGACVQAASVLLQREAVDVAAAWGLGGGDVIEPGPGASATADIRGAYHARRDREV